MSDADAIHVGDQIIDAGAVHQAAWAAIALTASVTLILAFGEVFVIIGGGLDISYAGVIGLTGIAGGMVMGHFGDQKMNPSSAILIRSANST